MIKKLLLLLIFSNLYLFSYEKYVDLDLVKEAGPPRFIDNGILFTLPLDDQTDVYLRTNLDNWQNNHQYKPNLYNVLYVFIPLNHETVMVKYKININGYWITDPYNTEFTTDEYGTRISLLRVPNEDLFYEKTPIILENETVIKEVIFKYFDSEASDVNFVCSIDNWSEYSHPMKKNTDGVWEITKSFTKGTYMYYFLVNGNIVTDINNDKKLWDKRRGQVSFFTIK